MSSESTPVVIIDYDNPSGFYWDVSTITTKVVYEYGRNRPFALAEVVVKKAYFNSDTLYWNKVARCPTDSDGKVILPNIVLGETTIHIEAYGESYNMYIEKMTSNDDYITLLCYNSAYKLKSAIYLSSLTNVIFDGTNYYLEIDPINPLTKSKEPTPDNRVVLKYDMYISNTQKSTLLLNCIVTGSSVMVDYIEGKGSDIFRFIAVKGAGYDVGNCIIDEGFSYNYKIIDDVIKNEYTEDDVRQMKSVTPYITPSDDMVKLRVNYLCWDVLKALGYLSNRYPFFYDHAYFVDYNNSAYCNTFKEMKLDYGVDEKGLNKSYTIDTDGNYQALNIYAIVDSLDQGTTYVMSGQEVVSENHSEYVHITDAVHPVEGKQIVFPYPESYDNNVFSNDDRNTLSRKLALQRMTTYYRPLDCIQFTISEIDAGGDNLKIDGIVFDESELPVAPASGTIYQVTDGLMNTYYIYQSADGWQPYTFATYSNTRKSRFDVYTCIDDLTDAQNNIHMVNAPLSYVQLSWPECVTTLSFGNPEFIDSAWQLANLEQGNETSVAEGTTDLSISDRQAAKIVVGNQTLSDLNDDRTGFTGLILEKNRDKELYRLAGYNDGELEAFFDSKGRILSGNASFSDSGETILSQGVMIDHNGIVITGGGDGRYVTYTEDGGKKVVDGNTFNYKSGSIGYVVLNGSGITTYDKNGTVKCYMDTNGVIHGTIATFSENTSYADRAGSADTATTANSATRADIADTATNATNAENANHANNATNAENANNANNATNAENANNANNADNATNAENAVYATTAGYADTSGESSSAITKYVEIDANGLRTYSVSGRTKTLQCQVDSTGNIKAGGGRVRLNKDGIFTYKNASDTTPVCYIDTNGRIVGTSAVFATNSDYATSSGSADTATTADSATTAGSADSADVAYSSSTNYVVIDSRGLRTYSSTSHSASTLQCEVGSNGKITAGAGNVTIGADGIAVKPKSSFASYFNLKHSKGSIPLCIDETGNYPRFWFGSMDSRGRGPDRKLETQFGMGKIHFDADLTTIRGTYISALTNYNLPNYEYGTGFTWYIDIGESLMYSGQTPEVFRICGGFNTNSSAGSTTISFSSAFSHVYGASCTTGRTDSSGKGNDYVSALSNTSVTFKHDGGGPGFSWLAWGIAQTSYSHYTGS